MNIRSIIALLVLGTYMLSLIVAIIFPFLKLNVTALDEFSTYFSKTIGAYTGIVGVIVGYYFARNTDNSNGTTRGPETAGTFTPLSPGPTNPGEDYAHDESSIG